MKDLSVEIRLRNNRLLARRKELGVSQECLAGMVGMSLQGYGSLETMRDSPLQTHNQNGHLTRPRWKPRVRKLADFYECEPEDLFPSFALSGKPAVLSVERNEDELGLLVGEASEKMLESPEDAISAREVRDQLKVAMSRLSPREQAVLSKRFGLEGDAAMSMDDIGAELRLSRERIRQIEAKALGRLRNPNRFKELHSAVGLDTDSEQCNEVNLVASVYDDASDWIDNKLCIQKGSVVQTKDLYTKYKTRKDLYLYPLSFREFSRILCSKGWSVESKWEPMEIKTYLGVKYTRKKGERVDVILNCTFRQ